MTSKLNTNNQQRIPLLASVLYFNALYHLHWSFSSWPCQALQITKEYENFPFFLVSFNVEVNRHDVLCISNVLWLAFSAAFHRKLILWNIVVVNKAATITRYKMKFSLIIKVRMYGFSSYIFFKSYDKAIGVLTNANHLKEVVTLQSTVYIKKNRFFWDRLKTRNVCLKLIHDTFRTTEYMESKGSVYSGTTIIARKWVLVVKWGWTTSTQLSPLVKPASR